jgi:hypothetical protein
VHGNYIEKDPTLSGSYSAKKLAAVHAHVLRGTTQGTMAHNKLRAPAPARGARARRGASYRQLPPRPCASASCPARTASESDARGPAEGGGRAWWSIIKKARSVRTRSTFLDGRSCFLVAAQAGGGGRRRRRRGGGRRQKAARPQSDKLCSAFLFRICEV